MTTHNKPATPTTDECQAQIASVSLIADYLKNAKTVLSADNLFGYDPQIAAALIVAQSIDRHSEVVACELRRIREDLRIDLRALEDRLAVALGA